MLPVLRLTKSEAEKLFLLVSFNVENQIALRGLLRFWEYPFSSNAYQPYYNFYNQKQLASILDFLTAILSKEDLEKVENYLLKLVLDSSVYFQEQKDREIVSLQQDLQKSYIRRNWIIGFFIVTLIAVFWFAGWRLSTPVATTKSVYYPQTSSQTTQIPLTVGSGYSLVVWTSVENSCQTMTISWGYDAFSKIHGHPVSHSYGGLTKFVFAGGEDRQVKLSCKGPVWILIVPSSTVNNVLSDVQASANREGVTLPTVRESIL